MASTSKAIIIIAGPTAVGKTAVAIAVAKHFNTEIISADSRQCYKELNIGVARPSEEDLQLVPHHFIASHSIHQKVTAATFEAYALSTVSAIFQTHDVAVMVGGTGLYINAFCEGMDDIPEVPQAVHEEVVAGYKENGLLWLQQEVERADTAFSQQGEMQNPQRLMRALEVVKSTGKSVLDFRKGEKKHRPFNIIKIGLEVPKEQLHQHINNRVDKMMEQGLPDEVQRLLPYQHLNALQTVGYQELFQYYKAECSLPQATEAIKQHTRQYAKRQFTWFKKDKAFIWTLPAAQKVISQLQQIV